jgi:glycosyltransferase involved in cell wall biosynthesis
MRVAFLTHEPFYPPSGGGSAEAVYLVEEFVRRGHEVVLYCPAFPDAEAVAGRFGVTVHPFTTWPMGRYTKLREPKYLAYPWFLARHVARTVGDGKRPDLWFAQHTISSVAAWRLRKRFGGVLALNFLDYLTGFMESWPAWAMPRPVVGWMTRQELALPRRADAEAVLTVSVPLAERFIAAGTPKERVRPMLYGYDAERFRPPVAGPAGGRPPGPPVVVMHGSFDKHHLGPIAEGAVAFVHAERPDVRWRFLGKVTPTLGAFAERMKARLPGVGIELPGFVDYATIGGELGGCDLGWIPYQSTNGMHCAFVAKAVEYLGCGLPVASTRLENLSRHFHDEPAIRFADFDGPSLGKTVLGWLATPAGERERLGRAAAERVAAMLDWRTLTSKALDFVEGVVHGTPRRG